MQDLIQELFQLRSEISLVKRDTLKPLEDRKKEVEEELMRQLDEIGLDSTKINGVGSVSVKEETVANAEDWTQFYEFIQSTGSFHLLNRAINNAAYRETLQTGEEVPGVVPFKRKKLSVRAA